MRLNVQGRVAPPKRDFTSIFMNIKEFIGSAQNAHPPEYVADSAFSPPRAF
jgi:hypothetical protein